MTGTNWVRHERPGDRASTDPGASKLSLDAAIKRAQEWQESAEMAIPAEIVTGLVDGALALTQALEDVRILLLPDSRHDMRPSMTSITLAKERIRKALTKAKQS